MDTGAGLCVLLVLLLKLQAKVNGVEQILAMHSVLNSSTDDEPLQKDISKLLNHIRTEFNYDYIVLWRRSGNTSDATNCIFDSLIKDGTSIPAPLMVNNRDSKKNILSDGHTKTLLILSCWEKFRRLDPEEHNASEFPFKTCHLIWVENYWQVNDVCGIVSDLASSRHLIINRQSLAIKALYTCNRGQANEINYNGIQDHFRREFLYLKGFPIVTESEQLPPRSILYYDKDGVLQLEGFVGQCISSFAWRHEAKLIITPPVKLQETIFYEVLENKTLNGLLDLPAAVSPLKLGKSDVLYSYPLQLEEYCYMIPLPHLMDTSRVFTYIIEIHVMIVIIILSFVYGLLLAIGTGKFMSSLTFTSIVLNDKSIRGLLGQSFVMPTKPSLFFKYICFLLCYTSLIIATTYQAYLQSHLIHPSLGKRAESYQDMKEAGLKIAITTQELHFLSSSEYGPRRDLIEEKTNIDDFLRLRASMDTHFAYPVTHSRWQVFIQQQKLFQRPLFYYSNKLCLEKLMLLSVAFRPNLPYKALFNQHLLEVRQTGLLQYWINDHFYAMVRLNYTPFSDLSTPEVYGDAIELNDFKLIWILYGSFMAFSFLVFACEMIIYNFSKKSDARS